MKSIRRNYLKELDDLLGPIDPKIAKEMDEWFEEIERRQRWMEENNISKDLQKFYFDLEILKSAGYKPIAVTTMMCENTFVFETQDEANRAFLQFEKHPQGECISGWWYGREDFSKALDDYKKEFTLPLGYEPHVIWF